MTEHLFPHVAVQLARFVVGGIFLWSGGVKLSDLEGFALLASTYSIVPDAFRTPAKYMAYLVPFTELVAGALLITWEFPLYALGFIAASLVFYTGMEAVELLVRGGKDNCGCYGTSMEIPLSWKQVAKNVVLLLLTGYLAASILL